MPEEVVRYPRYRFPPAIISHAVWLYYRFTLSFRNVEDLLAERGITVDHVARSLWHTSGVPSERAGYICRSNGFRQATPVQATCRVLRVTSVSSWTRAVAAIRRSTGDS